MRTYRGYSLAFIKEKVADIHSELWRRQFDIWGESPPEHVAMLDLKIIARIMGIRINEVSDLGQMLHGYRRRKVAGCSEPHRKRVSILNSLVKPVWRFTLAHELGHVVLHPNRTLFRDVPIDGSSSERNYGRRNGLSEGELYERDANRFAALLLMPHKLLRRKFYELFSGPIFADSVGDDLCWNLSKSHDKAIRPSHFRQRKLRYLSRIIADYRPYYTDFQSVSLAEMFGTSSTAMAIELENSGLVKRAAKDFDAFLCYNSADRTEVSNIAAFLERRGLNVCIDIKSLTPGEKWSVSLSQFIQESRTFIVFIGETGISPGQKWEIDTASKRLCEDGFMLIPVFLPGARKGFDLPPSLKDFCAVDFRSSLPDPFSQLYRGIAGSTTPRDTSSRQEQLSLW